MKKETIEKMDRLQKSKEKIKSLMIIQDIFSDIIDKILEHSPKEYKKISISFNRSNLELFLNTMIVMNSISLLALEIDDKNILDEKFIKDTEEGIEILHELFLQLNIQDKKDIN